MATATQTFTKFADKAPVYAAYVQTAAAGTAPPAVVFVSDGYYELVEVRAYFDVVGSTGAAADLKKVPTGTAIASGTSMLGTTFNLTTGARTTTRKGASALATAQATRRLAPGDSLAVITSGTLTGLTGLGITIVLKRYRSNNVRV